MTSKHVFQINFGQRRSGTTITNIITINRQMVKNFPFLKHAGVVLNANKLGAKTMREYKNIMTILQTTIFIDNVYIFKSDTFHIKMFKLLLFPSIRIKLLTNVRRIHNPDSYVTSRLDSAFLIKKYGSLVIPISASYVNCCGCGNINNIIGYTATLKAAYTSITTLFIHHMKTVSLSVEGCMRLKSITGTGCKYMVISDCKLLSKRLKFGKYVAKIVRERYVYKRKMIDGKMNIVFKLRPKRNAIVNPVRPRKITRSINTTKHVEVQVDPAVRQPTMIRERNMHEQNMHEQNIRERNMRDIGNMVSSISTNMNKIQNMTNGINTQISSVRSTLIGGYTPVKNTTNEVVAHESFYDDDVSRKLDMYFANKWTN